MSTDFLPAVIKNESGSGVLLVVIPDHPDGQKQPPPIIVRPGESSDQYVRSIDVMAAYSSTTGKPVDLQLLDMAGDQGKSAQLWKLPDFSHGEVKSVNGVPTLDMSLRLYEDNKPNQGYIPLKGKPSPSSPEVWGIDMNDLQKMVDEEIEKGAEKNHSLFGPSDHLKDFLKENFSAEHAATIYAAVHEIKASQKNPDYASEQDKGLPIG